MNGKKILLTGTMLLLLISLLLSTSQIRAESLIASQIYVVTNTANDGVGSLRQALVNARDHAGLDYIYFDIPTTDPGYSAALDIWFIRLSVGLRIEDADGVEIYGGTQDTTNAYYPAVVIQADGTPTGADLLTIYTDHNKVYDLGFFHSTGDGILIYGESNTIEGNQIFNSPYYGINLFAGANYNLIKNNQICGHSLGGIYLDQAYTNTIEENLIGLRPIYIPTVPRNGGSGITVVEGSNNWIQHNTISDNLGSGISLSPSGGNHIDSNTIGLSEDLQSSLGNSLYGIYVEGIGNEIYNNWVSGNARDGIRLVGSNTFSNKLEQNKIGISMTGTAPNAQHGIGIYNGAHDNKIGNAADADKANMIAGNGWSGVVVVDSEIGNNDVIFNYILYNNFYGVNIVNSPENNIIENKIIGNGELVASAGLRIENTSGVADRSDRNQVLYNSITNNSGIGIELANDANNDISAPTIFSASCSNVLGTTTPDCGTSCVVQIFSDDAEEGYMLEGTVTTVGAGNFSWSGFLNGPNVTATVTDALGNTSAFSVAKVNACIRKLLYLPLIMK